MVFDLRSPILSDLNNFYGCLLICDFVLIKVFPFWLHYLFYSNFPLSYFSRKNERYYAVICVSVFLISLLSDLIDVLILSPIRADSQIFDSQVYADSVIIKCFPAVRKFYTYADPPVQSVKGYSRILYLTSVGIRPCSASLTQFIFCLFAFLLEESLQI